MSPQDDLLADLPAPNPEEPASLRRDIADELRDHLECAVKREAVTHQDPDEIEHRVFARFGNPRQIARRLWLDWMKEKLMMQKITLALVSLVAVVSLGACGLMWSLAQDFQAASSELLTQGRDANQELLKQNQAMMAKLSTLADRPAGSHVFSDWFPLKVRLIKDDKAKSPAVGFHIHLTGPHVSDGLIDVEMTTDENGIADFGKVRPGRFTGQIAAPWGESTKLSLTVKPGSDQEKEVTCPAEPPKSIEAKPVVKWPKELKGEDVALLIKVSRDNGTNVGNRQWSGGGDRLLLIRPDGRFASYGSISRRSGDVIQFPKGGYRVETVAFYEPMVYDETFSWPGRDAAFSEMKIVQLAPDAEFPQEGESLTCLLPSHLMSELKPRSRTPFSRSDDVLFRHKAEGDGAQEWTIEIPKDVAIVARAALAPAQFPDLPEGYVSFAALQFFKFDKDGNMELSEAEDRHLENPRLGFINFPVSYKDFVTEYCVPSSSTEARYVFSLLDKNDDGQISGDEWNGSKAVREGFERAGITLELPADRDTFLDRYPPERIVPQLRLGP